MIDIDTCHRLLKRNISDNEIENIRTRLYSLAKAVVNKFEEIKSLFITRLQTITCKGRIVKLE